MADPQSEFQTFQTLRRTLPLDINLLLEAWNLGYEEAAFQAALEEIKRLKIENANLRSQRMEND